MTNYENMQNSLNNIRDTITRDNFFELINNVDNVIDEGNKKLINNGLISKELNERSKLDFKKQLAKDMFGFSFDPNKIDRNTVNMLNDDDKKLILNKASNSLTSGAKEYLNNYMKDIETTETTKMPAYTFEKTPEMLTVENEFLKQINAPTPTFTAPKFDTKYVNDWEAQLEKIQAPGTAKAVEATKEQLNYLNPYMTGSGSQNKAISDLMANITANRLTQAMTLGEQNYQQEYNKAQQDYINAQNQKANALSGMTGLNTFYEQAKQAGSQDAMQNYWNLFNSKQQQNLLSQQYAQQQNQWEQQAELARELAAKQQAANKTNWWQSLLTPVATGVGMALGGPIGGAIGSGVGSIFSSKQSSPTNYASLYSPSVSNSYGYPSMGNKLNTYGYPYSY